MPLDELRIFMGDPYVLNEHITIRQPTIREIIDYGEREYFSLISVLTAHPSDFKSVLWDMGIDYTKISNFEMFVAFCRAFPQESTAILFGDLDFSRTKLIQNDVGGICLIGESGVRIDWNIHRLMSDFLTKSNMLEPNRDNPGTEETKMMLIEWDKEDRAAAANKPYKSQLANLISTMVNAIGFKYDHRTVQDITIYQFFDAVYRLQVINSAQAMLMGLHCNPYIDHTKNYKDSLNMFKDLNKS